MNWESVKEWISSLDGFPKFDTAYLEKTKSGGWATILTATLMLILMSSELFRYIAPPITQHYIVDPTIGTKITMTLDISIASECEKLVLIHVEQTGETRVISDNFDFVDEIFDETMPIDWVKKVKVVKNGDDMSYQTLNGCHISGSMEVTKGAGRLMILPLVSTLGPMGELLGKLDDSINFSHYIRELHFGKDYPGLVNPLDNANQLAMQPREHFTYFLSILPTLYKDNIWGRHIYSNQYVLNGFKGKTNPQSRENLGLFFRYEHEALAVIISRIRISLRSFLMRLVGILGGVFVCSGLLCRIYQSVWQMCLWTVGKDNATKRSKRFDPGWSPVMTISDKDCCHTFKSKSFSHSSSSTLFDQISSVDSMA